MGGDKFFGCMVNKSQIPGGRKLGGSSARSVHNGNFVTTLAWTMGAVVCGSNGTWQRVGANQRKHKVSFETASLVFSDPLHRCILDLAIEGEERWQTMGMVVGVLLL